MIKLNNYDFDVLERIETMLELLGYDISAKELKMVIRKIKRCKNE